MSERLTAPGMMLRMLEGRVGLEATQLLLQFPLIRLQAKRGHGEPVLVLPGFMSDDSSTIVLRQFLSSIGYRVKGWGQGVNRARMLDLLPPLHEMVESMAKQSGVKVKLVGWSRGGILAREIARDAPELVDRVITIGSPVKGGVEASSIGALVRRTTGLSPAAVSALLKQRQMKEIKVPIRAIYSKLDGVVSWQACIDNVSPDIEHYEIMGSHIGMGTNVDVFKLLPNLLRA